MASPQAMQSAIAAGHHGVPNSSKKVIRKKLWSGRRSARGLLAKPTNRPVIIYIRFFMYESYDLWKIRKAHCRLSMERSVAHILHNPGLCIMCVSKYVENGLCIMCA